MILACQKKIESIWVDALLGDPGSRTLEREDAWDSSDTPDSSMDQREVLVEVVVAVEDVVAASSSTVHAVDNFKSEVVDEMLPWKLGVLD